MAGAIAIESESNRPLTRFIAINNAEKTRNPLIKRFAPEYVVGRKKIESSNISFTSPAPKPYR